MLKMIRQADSQAKRCLIGGLLIKFATGMATTWGTCNIYFFSYFRYHGEHITKSSNSIVMLCVFIPMCLASILATALSKCLGYKLALRICAVLFTLCPLVINIGLSYEIFLIFWLIIPLSCLCLSAIPLIGCLWSQFTQSLNHISGLALIAFSFGMIFWNIFFLLIINPSNQKSLIDENGMPYFSLQVSQRLFKASNISFLLAGVCNIVGSFMIQKKQTNNAQETQMQTTEVKKVIDQPIVQINQVVQRLSRHSQRSSLIQKQNDSLWSRLTDRRFIWLFIICLLLPTYAIYLWLNLKLIYMPIINDDHFLSFCSTLVTMAAFVGAPFWAHFSDAKGFKYALLTLVCSDLIIKIFGIYCSQKWSLALLFFLLGVNDKGMITIVGPGLIEMFGLEGATQLIPYKALAVFIGYLIVPLVQISLVKDFGYQQILIAFTVLSGLSLVIAVYFYFRVYRAVVKNKKEQELKQFLVDQKKNKNVKGLG